MLHVPVFPRETSLENGLPVKWPNLEEYDKSTISHSKTQQSATRPTLERRATLGHLRSIKPNVITHFANQSQTCELLK